MAILPLLAVILDMTNAPASRQDDTSERALAGVVADYERLLKQMDPVTAGLDGDREALRRLPDPRRETETRSKPRARGHPRAAGRHPES